jgi:nicotinamidase/pyrazinamidase
MKTLIIVDLQNDFVPGGALAVPEGDQIIPVVNRIQDKFDLVIASQDWHPANHVSFASNHKNKKPLDKIEWHGTEQILWPDHCVQETWGAELHPDLNTKKVEAIFRNAMDPEIDSYSGFYDNDHKKSSGLTGFLHERKADDLYFCGLAADVCVYFSIKDALQEGFSATLIEDATRAIDADEYQRVRKEITEKGCKIINSSDL